MEKKQDKKMLAYAVNLLLSVCVVMFVFPAAALANDTAEWTIGIYMCGTDLESKYGSATSNLLHMIEADIPSNVNVVVLTGGTKTWDPNGDGAEYGSGYIKPDAAQTQLWKINDSGMVLQKNLEEQLDMSSPETLSYFASTVLEDYPSKRAMLVLWDHGGGPIMGIVRDEYTNTLLNMSKLIAAFDDSIAKTDRGKIDILGMDACLMSNMEVASCLAPYADYLLASAEVEPDSGWQYMYWLNDLSEAKGNMEPVNLGLSIIDSYAYSENNDGDWSNVKGLTLALTDLSKIGSVKKAFDEMAFELSTAILSDDELFAKVLRQAEKVDNMYEDVGLLDLYDFANSVSPHLDSAEGIMEAVGIPPGHDPENFVGHVAGGAVIYRGTGYSHSRGAGLTFYYPTSKTTVGTKDKEQFEKVSALYRNLGVSDIYSVYLYNTLTAVNKLQEFTGEMIVEGGETNYYLKIDDPIALKKVSYITTQRYEEEDGTIKDIYLGEDITDDDWDAGIFKDNFNGRWGTLDDNICTMNIEVVDEDSGLIGVLVPVIVDDNKEISIMTIFLNVDEDFKYSDGACIISIMDISGDDISRTYSPDKDTKIYTLLMEFDQETGDMSDKYEKNPDPIVFTGEDEDGNFLVNFGIADLMSGQDYVTVCYFKAVDVRGNEFLSEPYYYVIINDLKEMTVEPIPDQTYTGSAITPKVRLTFSGSDDILIEGIDYKVEYSNNINRGQAKAVVTPIVEGLNGSLDIYFNIK